MSCRQGMKLLEIHRHAEAKQFPSQVQEGSATLRMIL
jgi:hypothetical protein